MTDDIKPGSQDWPMGAHTLCDFCAESHPDLFFRDRGSEWIDCLKLGCWT